jgi:hypothetical protein
MREFADRVEELLLVSMFINYRVLEEKYEVTSKWIYIRSNTQLMGVSRGTK